MMMMMMMMTMYKVNYNLFPDYISDILNLKNRSLNVTNSDNFMIPRISATLGKHSIVDILVL